MTAALPDQDRYDAVVMGGGFYGCVIAAYLAKRRGLRRVLLVEREAGLLRRASYNNQARVHNGYHYPRSFTTAYRSRVNLPRFLQDWPSAVRKDLTKVYAIARHNSKVSARQFVRFCREIGARLEPADAFLRNNFEPSLIEDVFVADEYVFDATELGRRAADELAASGIDILCETTCRGVATRAVGEIEVRLSTRERNERLVRSRYVFNCTYSGLSQIGGEFTGTLTPLKHEITEMALMEAPPVLRGLGVTVMDGAFFSMMPFPARGLHTLSHVRYTPHLYWQDVRGVDPYARLAMYKKETRFDRMVRDAARYMPAIRDARYVESLFEVKTVLVHNEADDGRPILFERDAAVPGLCSVLGGKIDNIYDVLERIDAESICGD